MPLKTTPFTNDLSKRFILRGNKKLPEHFSAKIRNPENALKTFLRLSMIRVLVVPTKWSFQFHPKNLELVPFHVPGYNFYLVLFHVPFQFRQSFRFKYKTVLFSTKKQSMTRSTFTAVQCSVQRT